MSDRRIPEGPATVPQDKSDFTLRCHDEDGTRKPLKSKARSENQTPERRPGPSEALHLDSEPDSGGIRRKYTGAL